MSNVLLHHRYRQTDEILVGATLKGKALNHAMLHMAYQAHFQKVVCLINHHLLHFLIN
jgi:hypothetical protein